jgi:hypothetical protein
MDWGLVDWGVQSPVLRLVPESLGFPFQNNWRECFGYGEESNDAANDGDDQSYPRRPSPAQITFGYELSCNRASDWTEECRTCEGSGRDPTVQNVPEISVCTSYDGDRGGAETACEKAADHYGFDVLCHGYWDLEDREDREADE